MPEPVRVLLVDDDEDDYVLTRDLLAEIGKEKFDLEWVSTYETALEAIEQDGHYVYLLDYRLGEHNGLELLHEALRNGCRAPMILLTGQGDRQVDVEAMKAGAADYLVKGQIDAPVLERSIRYALERARALESLRESEATNRTLLAETQRRLKEQIALREAGAIISSRLDLEAVLSRIAEQMAQAVDATSAYICSLEAETMTYTVVAEYIGPQACPQEQVSDLYTIYRDDDAQFLETLQAGQPDISQIDDLDLSDAERAHMQQYGARTILYIPLQVRGQVIALAELWESRRQREFTSEEIALCQALAQQAAIAIENARTLETLRKNEERLQRHNRELALFNRLIAASTTELEPESILEIACRELALALDVPCVTASLLNDDKTMANVVAEYQPEGWTATQHKFIPVASNPSFQYLLSYKAPMVVGNIQSDPRLAAMHGLLHQRGINASLLLPLVINGEVVGSLDLYATEPRNFSPEEVSLAWSAADQVSGALARSRLAQTRQRLITAIEQAAESVVITDIEGTILYVNPAFERTTGYSGAEAMGQKPHISKSGEQDTTFYEKLWATIRNGEAWHGRLVNKKKDGILYTVDTTITPVRDENGNTVNYVGLQRDVTHELELEEQYRQAQKMETVGRLAAGIAHDFNNMLTAINGFAELLQFELAPDDPRQELVDRILSTGQRAADLVRQLLDFSRKQIIEPKVLNLNAVVSNMDGMLRRIIGEDIDLETKLTSAPWPFKADLAQIERVIVNLVVNARDAMPDGGKLTIETDNAVLDKDYIAGHCPDLHPGEYVVLTIKDTGIGMSEEVVKHIFEPFFTTKEQGKGTGLGLATVFGIVKQNFGDIQVQSTESRGATFSIYLPRSEEASLSLPPAQTSPDMPPGRETILLVEDNAAVRELARQVLQRQHYTLLEAQDGQEALQISARHPGSIHLLLTDVVMPGMSGKVLAEQLAQTRPDLKILFMSGYTDDAILRHGGMNSGVTLLQKPFSPMALTHKVRTVLKG